MLTVMLTVFVIMHVKDPRCFSKQWGIMSRHQVSPLCSPHALGRHAEYTPKCYYMLLICLYTRITYPTQCFNALLMFRVIK